VKPPIMDRGRSRGPRRGSRSAPGAPRLQSLRPTGGASGQPDPSGDTAISGTGGITRGARAPCRRRRSPQQRRRTYWIADASVLVIAVGGAVGSAAGRFDAIGLAWGLGYAALTLVILQIRGFYSFRLQAAMVDTLARLFAGSSIAAMSIAFARSMVPVRAPLTQMPRLWLFALVCLGGERCAITLLDHHARRRGTAGYNTLIVGAGGVGHLVARRLLERPELGLRPVGFLDNEPLLDAARANGTLPRPATGELESCNGEQSTVTLGPSPGGSVAGLPVLGASGDLEQVIERHGVEQAIVTFSTAPHWVLVDLIRRCRALKVKVAVVPRLFEEVNNRASVEHLGGIPLLRAEQINPRGWQFAVKYAIDRVFAAVTLTVIWPLLLAISAAVWVSSPGPILYRQRRRGFNGNEFDMLKFRSMRVDPTPAHYQPPVGLAPGGIEGPDRRTPIGKLIRRLSLDELPQFINVLAGDMSLVGPRPERVNYASAFQTSIYRYNDRHRVKPGLTGWAQVHGLRGQTSLSDRVEWDNYYIENWTLWLDLKILLITIPSLLGWMNVD
jgi:lipopolysaccharide/colanic/teichoic acid biosynthesis glycosyltransferase